MSINILKLIKICNKKSNRYVWNCIKMIMLKIHTKRVRQNMDKNKNWNSCTKADLNRNLNKK
mgnify:CR=1 FL=1